MITTLAVLLVLASLACVALAGMLGRAHRKYPRPRKPPKPECGCGHELAYHDPATKACHAEERHCVSSTVNSVHQDYKYEWKRCQCRQYTGPERLPEYYAPEITP